MEITTLARLPSLGSILARAATTRGRSGGSVPGRGLRVERVTVDRANLLAYQRVCGFNGDDRLPHTYPHVVGFPLQMTLMSAGDFPMPLAGLVHIENAITVHRSLTAGAPLDLTVHAQNLRPHHRGRTVDLITSVEVAGEVAWEGRSTYLALSATSSARSPLGSPVDSTAAPPSPPSVPSRPIASTWRLPAGLGRSYAAVSGDVNPIHLSAVTARALGFRRAIAHGMWTYARTLAALGAPVAYAGSSHVWFRKPVFLPGSVSLIADVHGGAGVAALVSAKDREEVHLLLRTEP